MLKRVQKSLAGKPIFNSSPQTSVMRFIFFPALALALIGASLLPGDDDQNPWSGPVVLNRAPPPPSGASYQQAYAQAWAPAYLPPADPVVTVTRVQIPAASLAPAAVPPAYAQDEGKKLNEIVNQDIARMKAIGIGMQNAEAPLYMN